MRTVSVGQLMLAGVAALALAACDGGGADAKTAVVKHTAVKGPAGPQRDWTRVVAVTPEGGVRMGNPNAPVKLVEYASFTCPHCAKFHNDSEAALEAGYVRPGRVSFEYRPFPVHGAVDIAAILLARCNGAPAFFGFADALYKQQESWTLPFTKLTQAQLDPLNTMPQAQQIKAYADLGGLPAFARARGVSGAKYNVCMIDAAKLAQVQTVTNQAEQLGINSTPTFLLNGTKVEDVGTWPVVEGKLKAALS